MQRILTHHLFFLYFHTVKRFLSGGCNIIHNIYEEVDALYGIERLKAKKMFHTQILSYAGVNKKETKWRGLLGEVLKVKRNEKKDCIQHKNQLSLHLGF